MIGYHFVGEKLRDGRPVPKNGEWLEHEGRLELCNSGLHWSKHPFDALKYAPGYMLCVIEADGETLHDTDKSVSQRRKIIKRIDGTDLLRGFARWQAYQVLYLWEAPEIVKRFVYLGLDLDRDASRDASRDAAWDAAWAASRDAAMDAVRAAWAAWAAWDAAWAASRDAAMDAVRAAWAAMDAARDAAWAASRDAAMDAVRDAAWDAVRAAWAARDAARDAAWAASRDAAMDAAWAAWDDFQFLVDFYFIRSEL